MQAQGNPFKAMPLQRKRLSASVEAAFATDVLEMTAGHGRHSAAACVAAGLFGIAAFGFGAPGAFAQAAPQPTLDLTTVPKYVIPLVIPPQMPRTDLTQNCPDGVVCPSVDYNIAERQLKQQILPGGIWNAVNGRSDSFNATTVWSYGPAKDSIPGGVTVGNVTVPAGVAPVPASLSSFNYPAFTVEVKSQELDSVRWINELVAINPATNKPYPLGSAQRTFVPPLVPVDRSLHFANPERLPCANPVAGGPALPGATDCRPDQRLPILAKAYDGPTPMVPHVHGAEVNPYGDGFAESWWLPDGINPKTGHAISADYATKGAHFDQYPAFRQNNYPGSAIFEYENAQPATTLWYHDHTLGMTSKNVYSGPAGFWLVRGDYTTSTGGQVKDSPAVGKLPGANASGVLGRPTHPNITYTVKGVPVKGCDPNFDAACRSNIREIPIVFQDRSFNADGSLFYPTSRAFFDLVGAGVQIPYVPTLGATGDNISDIAPIHNPEFFGNAIVVNGTVWPSLQVAPQRYRLRLLAGADSRTFNLSMYAFAPGAVIPTSAPPTSGIAAPSPNDPKFAANPSQYAADLQIYLNAMRANGTELPFYQVGAEQGFLPKVVKVMTGLSAPLPGDGTEPAGPTCTPNVGAGPAADPLCQRALLMGPAERADVVVDFSGLQPGTKVVMINTGPEVPFNGFPIDAFVTPMADQTTTGQVMEFVVGAAPATPDPSTPPALLKMQAEGPLAAPKTVRRMSLVESDSSRVCVTVDLTGVVTGVTGTFGSDQPAGFCGASAVPMGPTETHVGTMDASGYPVPQKWADPITQAPAVGDIEEWDLYNFTVDAHPMHLHGARFEVVNREELVPDPVTGAAARPAQRTGVVSLPEPTEMGYKDVVIARPHAVTRIKAKYDMAGLYMFHCHIVEHEDNEMMVPYCVKGSSTDRSCTVAPGGSWPIVNNGMGLF